MHPKRTHVYVSDPDGVADCSKLTHSDTAYIIASVGCSKNQIGPSKADSLQSAPRSISGNLLVYLGLMPCWVKHLSTLTQCQSDSTLWTASALALQTFDLKVRTVLVHAWSCRSEGLPNGICHPCVVYGLGTGQFGELSEYSCRRPGLRCCLYLEIEDYIPTGDLYFYVFLKNLALA